MKKVLFFSVLLALCTVARPQVSVTTMKLSDSQHDFGTFKEDAGQQSYDFTITNTGSNPLVIQNVVASCGCTTPDWTRQPIPAGGTGKITAKYDPRGRPGSFNKTLTVYMNTKPETTVLTIKGEVIQHEKTVEELYTYAVGPVRFESVQLAFTSIKKNEKKIRVMPLINTSDAPVKVEFDGLPQYLTLKTDPETLKPGQKGLVEGTYDATKNAAWGNVSDMIRVKINGALQQNAYYYISANLVEDFSSLTKEQLASAPIFKPETTTIDLGKIKGNTQNEVEFKFTNAGRSDLFIRNVRSSCGCTAVQQGDPLKGIKPGQSSTIKAVFSSGTYNGKVTKTIYVYNNDPQNSEAVLMLNADVEQPEADKTK